ncbi:MAG: hypothetical protein E7Z80_01650 [Methanobrevibacter thaueri]|nr:hypothetical protein [Methanobrevibacter thaueri]
MNQLIQIPIIIIIFSVLVIVGKLLYKQITSNKSRFLNAKEYLPEDEITTLRQVYYLVMMLIFFVFILYSLIFYENDLMGPMILEIILLTYIAVTLDYSTWKNRILYILLVPYGSLTFLLFGQSIIGIMDLLHIIVYVYLIKIYFYKFKEYTETNSLGITIILLFMIILLSFILTTIVEGVGPLNAMVMVSNAFTSNGYAILGSTSLGKINSLILVWSGYILSGAGTATLTASILTKHFNKRFDKLEALIENNENEK